MILYKNSVLVVGVVATSAMLCAGCSKKARPDAVSTTHITSETVVRGDVYGAPSEPRSEYVRIARGDLDNLDRRIESIEVRPARPKGAQTAYELGEARAKLRDLRARVDAVPKMQTAVWAKEQPQLQADWDALVDRVDRISARLSEKP